MALAPGHRLGNYEIVAPAGAGGMGEVYRARDVRLERPAAIKALPDAVARDLERRTRFEREARLLAAVHHPGIASIFGIEEVDGVSYLALEWIEGETLARRIARGPLPVEEALDRCTQIAAAIDAAHEKGVVHRDLKPANIMVTPAGVIKVLDFGLARGGPETSTSSVDLSASPTVALAATADGVILGTAPYMSPEQARGRAVDRRTDVWALGCVIFECLTGASAFAGETTSDVIARILERDPDWSRLPASVPGRLGDLLRRCLTKNPAERPRDVGDLRAELHAIALDRSAPPSSAAAPAGPPSVAVLYFENLAADPESDYFCAGITEDILTDLSKLKGLRVASRNSVARFRGTAVDIPTVARELKVGTVLEGSVRRAGSRVRITAQLLSADGFHLWAERFDRTLEDVFQVQEEIASAISNALQVRLTAAEAERLGQDRPKDVRAYDLYLKGREAYRLYTPESMVEAERLFEQAIEIDSNYALAWAGLADTCGQLLQWNSAPDRAETTRRGLEAARRAIALQPKLAEGHKAEALMLRAAGDRAGARAALHRALEADPRHLPALGNLAVAEFNLGDLAGAERLHRRSLELEPDNGFVWFWLFSLCGATGRIDEAEACLEPVRRQSGEAFFLTGYHCCQIWALALRGRHEEIPAALSAAHAEGTDPSNLAMIEAWSAAGAGRLDEARRLLAEHAASPRLQVVTLGWGARAAWDIGDRALAVTLMNRPLIADLAPVWMRMDPILHPLLELEPFAPRRSALTLTWPIEAPMPDPRLLDLFQEVRLATGRPKGSDVFSKH